jgi:hypothetical protein
MDVTRPSSWRGKTGGSLSGSESPQVTTQGTPFRSSWLTTRCAKMRSSRLKRTISPGTRWANSSRWTTKTSPGRTAGNILVPNTRIRAVPDSNSTSAINSQPMVSRVVIATPLSTLNQIRTWFSARNAELAFFRRPKPKFQRHAQGETPAWNKASWALDLGRPLTVSFLVSPRENSFISSIHCRPD